MDTFFSFFGKLALILIIFGILVTGGYYLGTGKLPFPTNPAPGAVTTNAPEPTMSTSVQPTLTTAPLASPSSQTVTGGGLSGLSFSAYTFTVPASWTIKKDTSAGISEKITVSRGAYAISIYQAATGGAQCLYPGDTPGEMSTSFGPFVTLHDALGVEYRRATAAGSTNGFTVCQKGDSGFGLPTSFGHVTYTTPAAPDPKILQEMDAIFATLKKS